MADEACHTCGGPGRTVDPGNSICTDCKGSGQYRDSETHKADVAEKAAADAAAKK